MEKKISPLLFVSIALSSCASIPDLGGVSKIATPADYKADKNFENLPQKGWPKEQWWQNYQDPQLNNLIEEGLENSPNLAQARARLLNAQGIVRTAGGALYPSISLDATVFGNKQTYHNGMPKAFALKGTHYNSLAEVNFAYELDFFEKNNKAFQSALAFEKASHYDLAQAALLVGISIATTYSDLAKLYKHLEAAKEALVVRQKTADLFRLRTAKGLENEGTLEGSLSLVQTAQADLNAIEESIELAKLQLVLLMGKGPDRALTIQEPKIFDQDFGLPAELSSELLLRKPDLAAAKARVFSSFLKIDVSKANFYPSVNLLFSAGRQSLDAGDFFKTGAGIASFGPSFTLPIFNTKALQGSYIQARADYETATAIYNETLLKALNDVAGVLVKHKKVTQRLKHVEAAFAASKKAYKVINERYKAGVTNYLEVLRAEDSLILNRRALADVKSQAFTNDVELVKALGGGFKLNS
ncbi:MAG TPA: efflux transporter outer membrane subunit [Alphaproteobacteria bacterium]|nr:efflux transporter outer membrane subunit [Alphaproteobacteria bacterium]